MSTAVANKGKGSKGLTVSKAGDDVSYENAPLRSVKDFQNIKGGSTDHRIGTGARNYLAEVSADKVRPIYDRIVALLGGLSIAEARAACMSACSAFTFDALVAAAKAGRPGAAVKLNKGDEVMIKAVLSSAGRDAADKLRDTLLSAKHAAKSQGLKIRTVKDKS